MLERLPPHPLLGIEARLWTFPLDLLGLRCICMRAVHRFIMRLLFVIPHRVTLSDVRKLALRSMYNIMMIV